MHDDLDRLTAELASGLRATFSQPSPPAGADLRAMFDGVTDPSLAAAGSAAAAPRSRPMVLQALQSLQAKVSAAALGAALAVGALGVAGALPGSMLLTSNERHQATVVSCDESDESDEATVVDDAAPDDDSVDDDLQAGDESDEATVADDGATAAGDGSCGSDVDDESDEGAAASDGTVEQEAGASDEADASTAEAGTGLPAVPSSVRQAAQTHDFDEACGNHGTYVSHFARFGEEPECAAAARAGSTAEADDADSEGSTQQEADNHGQAKRAGATGTAHGPQDSGKGKGKGGRK